MELFFHVIGGAWEVLCTMAPYLLLGFLIAGVLSVWLSTAFVERHLGRPGLRQVVNAALFGIPVPLCSCSVIPVTASLRRRGASPGAVVSFLSSTPQTGVDSILVTHALLGPLFTGWRVLAALATGVLTGAAVNALTRRPRAAGVSPGSCGSRSSWPAPPSAASCCASKQTSSTCCGAGGASVEPPAAVRMLRYGLVTLPRDLGVAILTGLAISGLLGALAPPDFFADHIQSPALQMLVALLIGLPLYVCSTASVPIAAGLMAAGMTPGAALVFLVTGPATNAATFTTVAQLIGRRLTAVYLLTLAGCAMGAGFLLDAAGSGLANRAADVFHAHDHPPGWFEMVCAAGLLLLLSQAFWPRRARAESEEASPAAASAS